MTTTTTTARSGRTSENRNNRYNASNNRKTKKIVKSSDIETDSTSKLKKIFRDTTRLLKRDNLAPHIRIEAEKKLHACSVRLQEFKQDNDTSERERAFALRYKRVKFFERRKAERKLERIKRDIEQLSKNEASSNAVTNPQETLQELEQNLLEANVELTYIKNYPKLQKYISLYAEDKLTDAAKLSREQMKADIRKDLMKNSAVEKAADIGQAP